MTAKTTEKTEKAQQPRALRRWGVILPLVVFVGLAGLFWYALHTGDPSRLPSAMIGKPVPQFDLPPLKGLKGKDGAPVPGFSAADLAGGKPTIVNVFASWCVPCLQEHPTLLALSKKPGIRIFAINYKDDQDSARRFLGRYGNPFTRVGVDRTGRTAIDFGVYGVPETYVITADGKIAYRHVGPLTEQAIKKKIMPLMQLGKTAPQG
jgi:cytochrome c biogenesis protein CcmG/thiol:disulfide interchange protein DsbE